jgi:hypothetical protein
MRFDSDATHYALRWKYGTQGFFFQPEANIIDGRLCFSLQATTSSGSLSGERAEIPISDRDQIKALQQRGACWLEPDGQTKISLELKKR